MVVKTTINAKAHLDDSSLRTEVYEGLETVAERIVRSRIMRER